ncbi:MAG: Crp/Fnr family transcriptional regulator [Actinomycetota bacterium]|nr:Crp/Fnr family transcriptional regulator [Actinomycetota bacterium]
MAQLTQAMHAVELEPGTVLYEAGRVPTGIWMIRSGCIEISDRTSGRRRVAALLREGDIAGDLYVLTNTQSPLTARCLERAEVWFLPADSYRRVVTTCPSLTLAWLCSLASRLCDSRTRILEILGGTLEQRLARLLLEESVDGVLRLPQQTAAQMLGVQRTSLNKTLKRLACDGLVTIGYGSVRLHDLPRLRLLAEGSNVVRRSPVGAQDVAQRALVDTSQSLSDLGG